MRRYHKNSNGFTMAEMLITVAIIVILCGFGFVAVIAHQRNLKRMEMDETAQEIFIAAQNHLTAAEANGQWDAFLKKTSGTNSEAARGVELANGPAGYDKTSDKDAASRKFYSFTTESDEAVQKGAVSLILPEGSIDETLRGHHFYVEYDAASGTVYGVFYTDADHEITADDAEKVSRTDPNARRDYKDANGKRTIIGYYGGALGELKSSEDLYAPAVAVRNAESLVLYVVDKNYHRPASSETSTGDSTQTSDENAFKTTLQLTFEGETSGAKTVKTIDPETIDSQADSFSKSVLTSDSTKDFQVVVPGREQNGSQKTVNKKAKYYAIVLDSIVRGNGHFADLFQADDTDASKKFIPGEDIRITVTLHSNKGGEDVSQTVRVNSLFNSVKKEKNAFGMENGKAVVTVSNPRHLENLSTEVSGVDFVSKKIVKDTAVDTVSIVRNLFWDEDAVAEAKAKEENEKETVTAFLPAIASATGMESPFGYCADGTKAITKDAIQVYQYKAGSDAGDAAAEIAKGACYGITNTAIQNFEGNNHMLAAFRFEGEQESALINRAAAAIKVSDLVIADSTSCVTGEIQTGSDPAVEVPTAAMLIAKANSGYAGNDNNNSASVENVQIVWYRNGANQDGITTGNSKATTEPAATGTMVYSGNGIASLLIGSVDANNRLPEEEGKTSQQGTPTNKFTIKNVTIQAGDFGRKKTANVGVEGNVTAGLIGEIKSGAVTIGNSDDQTDNWKTNIKIHGTLTLNAVKGEKSAAGGLVGKVADTASTQNDALTLQKVYLEADTLKMNGRKNQNSILGGFIGSVEGGKSVHIENADLIAKSVNGGMEEKSQEWNADTTGGTIGSVTAGTKTELKDVRLTTAEGKLGGKQASGGVVGSLASGEASLESVNVRAVNKNEAEGQGQSAVKTFRDIEVALSDNASLTINADNGSDSAAGGLIGNVSGQVSKLNITKSSVKTVTADDKNADLTVTGANIGGLIGVCGAATSTIGGDGDNEVILTVQGNFSLAQSTQEAKNAGGLIGKIGQTGNAGNAVTANVQNVPLTARTMHAHAAGDNNGNGTVGGFVGYVATGSSSVSLSSCNLSANSIDLGERETNNSTNTVKAAGGAVGKISAGTVTLSNLTVLTPKASQDAGEGANDNYIRVIADRGTAGGLVGVAESGTTQLDINNAAVSGSGTNDQIEAGGSAGGLVGDSKAGQMSITNSMASMYVQTDGITNVTDSSTGAGGLVGSASGTVTIQSSYSGGRTTGGKYADNATGQGRYNVYLQSSTGAAGGILGKMASGSLEVKNSYSTSSVAVPKTSATGNGADAGGFVGFADSLNAENTYCTGRVYVTGNGSTGSGVTPHYGAYAGKLASLNGQENYYLKGIKGITDNAVGTLENTSNVDSVKTKINGKLTEADYADNNSPLRNNVPSDQKTYCYDTALQGKAYPLKSVTTASAHPLYDPNTGDKVAGESADGDQYAQIGDWEVPEKQSLDGAYGLIYYERIWDGTTGQTGSTKGTLDSTFYYHGYMLESGEDAKNANYKEIKSQKKFETRSNHYVAEDGYLLLIRKNSGKNLTLHTGQYSAGIGSNQKSIEISKLPKYAEIDEFADYDIYNITDFGTSDDLMSWFYYADDSYTFGSVLVLRDSTQNWGNSAKAMFTYLPFFADALEPADKGIIRSVSKTSPNDSDGKTQAIIRSARQYEYFVEQENKGDWASFLNRSNAPLTVEQQLDITFNSEKVQFTNNGTSTQYVSETLNRITEGSGIRSSQRKDSQKENDFYVLDGLTTPLVNTLYGRVSDLQVTNIKAPYFISEIRGTAETVTINDARFENKTTDSLDACAGFAIRFSQGLIENCHIINASILGTGFIYDTADRGTEGTIKECSIVNATIAGTGFINNNGITVENCGIYSDPDLYDKNQINNYAPCRGSNGNYDYVSIGISPEGIRSSYDIAGFILNQAHGKVSIRNCYVAGTIYGDRDHEMSGFVGIISDNLEEFEVKDCYANVVFDSEGNVNGFASKLGSGSSKITNCHVLGVIKCAQHASGMVRIINGGQISNCYSAFWEVNVDTWSPFYETMSGNNVSNCYYLSDYKLHANNLISVQYDKNKVKAVTYSELCGLDRTEMQQTNATESATKPYNQYLTERDYQNGQKIYPYPVSSVNISGTSGSSSAMPMISYGDWHHEDGGGFIFIYYEKVGDRYYYHGYVTTNGKVYNEIMTSGDHLEKGLLTETGKTVSESGYALILGKNSTWTSFGRADNSGIISSLVKVSNSSRIFTEAPQALASALETLKKESDQVYCFNLDGYLQYVEQNDDSSKSFTSWQTLIQESSGVGLSLYSTTGTEPVAKFSFQPFFADTVKKPTSDDKFADTKDSQNGASYRIRSVGQLQSLIDWDSKRLNVADPANTFGQKFDHEAKRYSYLSTSNDNCTEKLTIQQDMDIDAASLQHGFGGSDGSIQLDGNYIGRKYNDQSVALQNLSCDFAKTVASTGKISSLVIKNAQLDGQASTQAQGNGDIAHGGHKEFVEYNYGTLSDITVQDSTLGSAGLVYQNGDVTKNALKRVRREPSRGKNNDWQNWFAEPNIQGNACRYTITYTYEKNDTLKTGIIENCTVKNSTISGAGMVWRNKGGVIRNSSVEGSHDIGASGFVEYNEATSVQAPALEEDYEYWINMYQWVSNPEANGYKKVPDDVISKHNWPTKGNTSSTQISVMVDAVIENCSVKDSEYANNTKGVKGDGFVGVNTIDTQGSTSSTAGKAKAKISNCKVVNVVAAENGFAGENTNGAEISNCAVYADEGKTYTDSSIGNPAKNQSAGFVGKNGASSTIDSCSFTGQIQGQKIGGFAYTNEGTITKSYANISQKWNNTQIQAAGFVYENSGEILHCHALGKFEGSQTRKDGNNNGQAAGFVWNSAAGSKISNSYTAVWSEACMTNYWLFAKTDTTPSGTFSACYAMKPEIGTFTSNVYEISFVTGKELKTKTPELGNATGAETVTYTKGVEANYGFPVPTTITNFGDWYSDWDAQNRPSSQSGESGYAVSLTSGSGSFLADVVAAAKALSADGNENGDISLNSMEDAEPSTSAAENPDDGSTNEIDLTLLPEEDSEDGEAAVTLDLSTFTPVRKGWRLLGWLITSPSDLSTSEKKTTVSDIVTKINKISDGDADGSTDEANTDDVTGTGDSESASEGSGQSRTEASGSSKVVYELETGTKSYHYAPDAVITVTEDMTLSAVWVPDDDTVEKAKDGTLRMDVNGNILDGEEQMTNDVTNETTETDSDASAADTSSAVTGDDTDGMTSENQDASTDQTADASGTLPVQNTEDDMSEMSDLTAESDPEMETSPETTGEEGEPAGEK